MEVDANTHISDVLQQKRCPLGPKPDPVATGRRKEAERLTALMEKGGGFSFVRLGDKDLAFLIHPEAVVNSYSQAPNQITGTQTDGTPGLEAEQRLRLRRSLECASYLDYWERQWKDDSWLAELNLHRPPDKYRNPDRETSAILGTWLEFEFKKFCGGRRVMFCGAESPLIESLSRTEDFQRLAGEFWPSNAHVTFVRPRNNGKHAGRNLDAIKSDLRSAIQAQKTEVLFLSLGGSAKIICQELADELGICAIDFGVGMRSLTYSGSGGYMAARGTHLIYLYRVPFPLFMRALAEAYPEIGPDETLAKAHAQLLLELQEKEVGWSHAAWEYDFSRENLLNFKESLAAYQQSCRHLFRASRQTRIERAHFLHFCGVHKLTARGVAFLAWHNCKEWILRRIGRA